MRAALYLCAALFSGWWLFRTLLVRTEPSAPLLGRTCPAHLDALLARAAVGPLAEPMRTRRRLYEDMGAQLARSGLLIGTRMEQTQGLGTSSLFRMLPGPSLEAVLTPLAEPVRAVVLPFRDTRAAAALADTVKRELAPLLPPGALWPQDPSLFHATLFHASPHAHPVKASGTQVALEVAAVQAAAGRLCPPQVVLERVVLTPSGNLLACWQVTDGTDPAALRDAMRQALPRAPPPEQQTVIEPAILYTTLARIVLSPADTKSGTAQTGASQGSGDPGQGQGGAEGKAAGSKGARSLRAGGVGEPAAAALRAAVDAMSAALCGLQATLSELWYVEEEDLLALALGGRFVQHPAPLLCQDQPASS
ncbi:hypothetical protein WJX81_004792 [Elliptochloris bilobata]|uniref:Protein kinase A anchor protein nuclear localisation signal domain-containing protein n=1 Tax=Elliptochloris bilobata TaxID=381761 RepID=A0AAW1SHE5_9CHLO